MKKLSILMMMAFLTFGSLNVSLQAETNDEEVTMPDRMYSMVIDRFYNFVESNNEGVQGGDAAYPFGGDFRGIVNHLDYINDLGVNTIHISPVFNHSTDDYLGYAVTNHDIASAFGGSEDLTTLIEAAHDVDMKVVVDFPLTVSEDYDGDAEFSLTDEISVSELQGEYFERYGVQAIDMTADKNIEAVAEILETFVEEYDVDGVSFFILQDGVDGSAFVPEGVTSYAVTTSEDVEVVDGVDGDGFDHVATEAMRADVAHSFHYFDNEVMEYPSDHEALLMADHWFSDRFTYETVELRAFPGTRIQQLTTYLLGYPGPISYFYGTEVAYNGNTLETIHPQMTFWSDKEVYDYMKERAGVFERFPKLFEGETETVFNESGHYVVRYNTPDEEADFILRMNDSSETRGFSFDESDVGEDMMLSGVLTGEIARANSDGEYITVLDRETSDLFAIIDNVGLNHWYLIASVLIFGGFVAFLYVVAKRGRGGSDGVDEGKGDGKGDSGNSTGKSKSKRVK